MVSDPGKEGKSNTWNWSPERVPENWTFGILSVERETNHMAALLLVCFPHCLAWINLGFEPLLVNGKPLPNPKH